MTTETAEEHNTCVKLSSERSACTDDEDLTADGGLKKQKTKQTSSLLIIPRVFKNLIAPISRDIGKVYCNLGNIFVSNFFVEGVSSWKINIDSTFRIRRDSAQFLR